jgi:hypothetical protein
MNIHLHGDKAYLKQNFFLLKIFFFETIEPVLANFAGIRCFNSKMYLICPNSIQDGSHD